MKLQRGFTLLEIIAALAIGSIAIVGLGGLINTYMDDARGEQTGLYQDRVTAAVKGWISDPTWNAYIKANASATVPVKVTVSNLISTKFLQVGTATVNPYGQTPCALIYYDSSAGKINALITTEGGTAIPEKQLGFVAANSGPGAGYISTLTPAKAKGAFGSWEVSLADYTDSTAAKTCSGTAATGGRLASALFADASGTLISDYLYRNPVPGRPDLNTMNTPIILGSATIVEVGDGCNGGTVNGAIDGTVDTTKNGAIARDGNGKVVSCQSGSWASLGGSLYWGDPVNVGSNTPTKAQMDSALGACSNSAPPKGRTHMVHGASGQPRPYVCDGTDWQPLAVDLAGNITISGTATINALGGALTVVTYAKDGDSCRYVWDSTFTTQTDLGSPRPSGSIARDSAGLILSCQYSAGVWAWQANGGLTASSVKLLRGYCGLDSYCPPACPVGYVSGGIVGAGVDNNGYSGAWYEVWLNLCIKV